MFQIHFLPGITVLFICLTTIGTNGSNDYYQSSDEYPKYTEMKYKSSLQLYAKKQNKYKMMNSKFLDDLLNPTLSVEQVNSRLPSKPVIKSRDPSSGTCSDTKCKSCLDSCGFLKKSDAAKDDITQYTFLRMCSEGCKNNLNCLYENFCLPVMKENPNYFVICANKCNLFKVVPVIFKTTGCS